MPVLNFRTTRSHIAGFCCTFSGFSRSIAKLAVMSRSLWHVVQYWFTTAAASAAGAGVGKGAAPGCPALAATARHTAKIIVRCFSFMPVLSRDLITGRVLERRGILLNRFSESEACVCESLARRERVVRSTG